MSEPEFSRLVDERQVTPKPISIEATAGERKALARRFGIVAIKQLQATVAIERAGDALTARGRLSASIVQSCAVSGEDLPVRVDEPLALRFVPAAPPEGEEIELEADELDEMPFEGHTFDLGEAVAQSLALAIDPYAIGPEAERVRQEAGLLDEAASGPFAALAALKKGG
jgi:uncharacterized metal-binding protein YceD (DUF177 family)